jgi:phosphoribosylaminoimidazolecarboxamide formyltransferase/IMP cyclohydrolase
LRAILSVSDKTGLADFGRGLADLGVELVSTGGTATALAAAGLPVVGVSEVTGFPEMMDGRVKTLHPAIHAGILARRSRPDDLAAIARHGITPVDLVVVNLYPFATAAQNPDTPFDALVEEIDIGGPSLVRAAAKNFRDVLVVVDPADYPTVLEQMARPGGPEASPDGAISSSACPIVFANHSWMSTRGELITRRPADRCSWRGVLRDRAGSTANQIHY